MLVVTGASGAVGQSVMNLAKGRGIKVLGIDKAPSSTSTFSRDEYIGEIDLLNLDDMSLLKEKVRSLGGKVSALANIAGGFAWKTIEGSEQVDWIDMMRINFFTAMNSSLALLPYISDRAAIVNIGAAASMRAAAGMAPYTSSKSALARFSEALSEEVSHRGVRINMVSPTIIDTPTNRAEIPGADRDNWVTPSEVAECVLFLASPQSSGVNGANLVVGRV
ncbi:SDR family oxidoreductase [Erythrobacter sp. AP23]|uniref:SDR family oxidoreductase n=1 Tax=Erythrobacter sp. AP23 TaxID=499656 RepID=UPI000829B83D|nr:SDR family oxidoreductase [Erythrobacter sp. AP23]